MDEPETSDSRPILVEQDDDRCDDLDSQAESDDDAGDTDEASSRTVVSLLDRLRSPTPSDLAIKRSVQSNPPVGRKRSKKGGSSVFASTSISPYDRVKQYPGESLTFEEWQVVLLRLQRRDLNKELCPQATHKVRKVPERKERLKSNEKREMDLVEALQTYSMKHHPVGESLPDATRVYCIKTVTAFLKAGVPLSNVDNF